jgi:hypothetical protein
MLPEVNVINEQHVCLALRDLGGLNPMTRLTNMSLAWQVKPLELTPKAQSTRKT